MFKPLLSRVEKRYEIMKQKEMQEKRVSKNLKMIEIIKGERLKSLAESVPYYESISRLKADIFKTTNAARMQMYQGENMATSDPRFSFQHGATISFSDERCFSDFKFKLSHALHEAGLAQSSYSRDMVKQLIPRNPERTTGIEPS
jgi:hypothetical protein